MAGMRSILVSGWAILAIATASPILADGWIDTDGSAVATGGEAEDAAQARAEADALARGLARYLLEWFAESEMQRQMAILQPALFSHAQDYVEAVSDVSRSRAGARYYWRGRVRFDRPQVERVLRERGLVSPWAREPLFALEVVVEPAGLDQGPAEILKGRLAAAGIRVVHPGDLGDERPDGRWTLRIRERTSQHPTIPGRTWAVTEATIDGDIGGRPFEADLPAAPALSPPADLAMTLVVDRVIDLWAPLWQQARADAMWELGPLRFADHRAWLSFDRRLWAERGLFHDVAPLHIERDADGWAVRYGFFLPAEGRATAQAWLAAQGFEVEPQGERRFVVRR